MPVGARRCQRGLHFGAVRLALCENRKRFVKLQIVGEQSYAMSEIDVRIQQFGELLGG